MGEQLKSADELLQTPPDCYLGLAIWGLILFWPTAIAALVNSIRTNSLWSAGQYDEAIEASKAAQRWGLLSIRWGLIISGVVTTICSIPLTILILDEIL